MSAPCDRCPCPGACFGHLHDWGVFCTWAAEEPPDEGRLRHIRARSALPLEPPSPTPLGRAANLGRAFFDWAVSGFAMTAEEEAARRLAICALCPQYDRGQCRLCGCYLQAKVRMRTEKCPLPEPKW